MPSDTHDTTEDEPVEDDEELEDLEPTADDLAEDVVRPEPGMADVESIQELLTKQETREEAETAEEQEDEAVAAAPPPASDDRLESTESRVVPIQSTEFMCKNCFLVKHRSQLANPKKMLCRDCA